MSNTPSKQSQSGQRLNAFILEPILTPSALVDGLGEDTVDIDVDFDIDDDLDIFVNDTELDDSWNFDGLEILPFSEDSEYTAGVFTVDESGEVGIDFLFDGGGFSKGEVGIFSLEDLDFEPGSDEFIEEAVRRSLSDVDGHVIISDAEDGARFSGKPAWEADFNSGEYRSVQTFQMEAGSRFGIIFSPNDSLEDVLAGTASRKPLFSLATANPDSYLQFGQIADVTGDGNTFAFEDLALSGSSDKDYNDIVFQIRGATTEETPLMDDLVTSNRDWRNDDVGQALTEYAKAYLPEAVLAIPEIPEAPIENQPLVGIIDTGFAANNPDIDYDNITLGSDFVNGDDNPLQIEGEGSEHGTHILGIIAAEQDNGEGIDGINDDAPIWLGGAVGSGEWAESLTEFVNHSIESEQPNAVVNLSLDLTQTDADGNITTRYELTPKERAAIEYARQNNVLLVVGAGNDGGVMSALGQASQEFDNIITVGAAERVGEEFADAKAFDRAGYSSYGQGLNIVAQGGTVENPELSLTGDGVGTMAGTSVATAKVTGAILQVWAANPELSYRQVIEIIRNTATDLGATGDDTETGAGLLNMMAAVHLAKVTKLEEHKTPAILSPETWSGEGVLTPSERAIQNVIVPPEWRRWYYGWLNENNPSDTFSFSINEPTPLQFSLNFLGSAVLRKDGQVILKGASDGNALYAGSDGKLSPGNYVLTVDRGSYSKVDEYKLVMNFLESSQGQETPIVDYLPSSQQVQPPDEDSPVTDIPEFTKKLAEQRAKKAILEAYEAQSGKLGNALKDIQVYWKAFDGVNVPAVQYFDGGHIIWNGVSAIVYFTGTGRKLPDIDLPETVVPIRQPSPPANVLNVPDGRHTYPNMRGSSEYRVDLKGSNNDISLAARNTILAYPDLLTTVYRDLGNGQLQQVPLTSIDPSENYTNYQDLAAGKYLIKVDIEQDKANTPYEMVVNLDQAGGDPTKAWNLNQNYGQIDGKRIIVSDHVGLPESDKDLYAFTTSNFQPTLQFAVRSLYSDLNQETRNRLLDGDIKMRLLDANGDEVLSVDSENRKSTLAAEKLEPNSKYYVEVTAKNGSQTNYDLVLNFQQLWAPPGRHEFEDLTGQLEYNFQVDNNAESRILYTAVRDANGQTIDSSHYTSKIYYRKPDGQWVVVNPNSIGDSVFFYSALASGQYRVEMSPKPSMPVSNYTFVHNLDQAGSTRFNARNLGNIGGKRVTVNDHVGSPVGELDYYKFSTGSDPRLLQFAVRHPSGNGSLSLEGDVEFVLYDKNGNELKKVSSKNREDILGSANLDANSEYYVRVNAQSGNNGNYHLVLNAEVKRNTGGGSGNYYPQLTSLTKADWNYQSKDNLFFDGQTGNGESLPSVKQIYSALSQDIFSSYKVMTAGYFDNTNYSGTHYGIDMAGLAGNSVKTVVGGTTTLVQNISGNYFVGVKGDDGKLWIYGHLENYSVGIGQRVEAGTKIGIIFDGAYLDNGYFMREHLHLEVHEGHIYNRAKSISPLQAYWQLRNR